MIVTLLWTREKRGVSIHFFVMIFICMNFERIMRGRWGYRLCSVIDRGRVYFFLFLENASNYVQYTRAE